MDEAREIIRAAIDFQQESLVEREPLRANHVHGAEGRESALACAASKGAARTGAKSIAGEIVDGCRASAGKLRAREPRAIRMRLGQRRVAGVALLERECNNSASQRGI